MRISHLDHLVLTISDLEKSLRFYGNVLDMRVERTGQKWAVRFGKQKINFHVRPAEFLPAAKAPTPGSADLCLITEDSLESVLSELNEKGVAIEEGIVQRTGSQGPISSIYIRDPDQNLIEIGRY